MGVNKISSYIVHYKSRRKEAAEEERRRRIEDAKRRPEVVDPSFELFGYKSPPSPQLYDDPFHQDPTSSPPPNDDWLFQTRRASTLPQNYQFEPYCEITPKSSVSSTNSAASDARPPVDYDMGWETYTSARPRPQSYLPSSASASHSLSMVDLHRGSEHRSRRHSGQAAALHRRQETLPSYDTSQQPQRSYKLEATLTQPFSIDEPFETIIEPLRSSQHSTSETTLPSEEELSRIREHENTGVGADVPEYADDLVKRGYHM